MIRHFQKHVALMAAWMVLLTGCMAPRSNYFPNETELAYYKGVATDIEYPDIEACTLDEVRFAERPITLENFEQHEFLDLTLQEVVQTALANSKVVRRIGVGTNGGTGAGVALDDQFLGQRSSGFTTIYDPAIQDSNPVGGLFGIGTEAALSAFDAQLGASVFWERNERPINVGGNVGNQIFAADFQQDAATFQAQLSKLSATGTQFSLTQNTNYDYNNNPTRGVPSAYDMNVEAAVTQPLLRGAGSLFNRIAGPNAIPGVYNGVVIARINNELSVADVEAAVRNMVFDVEKAYWELQYFYRRLEAARKGRAASWDYLEKIESGFNAEREGRDVLSGARSDYFQFRAEYESTLSQLLQTERALRFAMGLSPTDHRIIRPIDEPTIAKVRFDWNEIHIEALARDVNLRQQKWLVEQKELELIASKNFLMPTLDAVALYRWLGAGDQLYSSNGRGVPPFAGSNAFSTLTDGNYQEWQLGFQFNMPLGFRRELAAVRNAELQLTKEKAVLQEKELSVSHLLSDAIRQLEDQYVLLKSRLNAWIAAKDRYETLKAKFDTDVEVNFLDIRESIRSEALAETEYYRALIEYNKQIVHVHFRKGSLLEYNNILLAEGAWPCKAYADARERANERQHALHFDYAITRPSVSSRGPVLQISPDPNVGFDAWHAHDSAEEVPTPEPTPLPGPNRNDTNPEEEMGEGEMGDQAAPRLGPGELPPPEARSDGGPSIFNASGATSAAPRSSGSRLRLVAQ